MDVNHFRTRITRDPEPNRKYLILTGARTGWVMPGNMLLSTGERGSWGGVQLRETVVPINPTVNVGDRVVPLRMRESMVEERTVREAQPRFIRVEGRNDMIEEWVVFPAALSDDDRALLRLQIREHLVLHGYEEESRRRGWQQFWRDVNESAGFTLRPVPSVMQVRAKWRVPRYEMENFLRPERMTDLTDNSDTVIMSHVITDHTILLPNTAAECRCSDHARVHRIGTEVTDGRSFRDLHDMLRVGFKQRIELHSVEVRQINCAFGMASA